MSDDSENVLVELARLPNAAMAHIWAGRLQSEGIHAVCFDTGMNIADSAALAIPVRLMVLGEQFNEARALMAEIDAASDESSD